MNGTRRENCRISHNIFTLYPLWRPLCLIFSSSSCDAFHNASSFLRLPFIQLFFIAYLWDESGNNFCAATSARMSRKTFRSFFNAKILLNSTCWCDDCRPRHRFFEKMIRKWMNRFQLTWADIRIRESSPRLLSRTSIFSQFLFPSKKCVRISSTVSIIGRLIQLKWFTNL